MGKTSTRSGVRAVATAVAVIVFLAGLLTVSYPIVASSLNDWEQSRVAKEFGDAMTSTSPEDQTAALEAAREYNQRVGTLPLYDAWNGPENPVSPEYEDYLHQLAQSTTMGQLVIPAINVNLPVYHGTDEDTLNKGIGHLYGTSLPVGGESTHAVLTGHTGMVESTLLNDLDQVKTGDALYVRTVGEDLKYEVSDIRVVLPDQTDSLRVVSGEDLLTVITCTPYGINSHRLLVTGHRVPMDPEESAVFQDSGSRFEWWMLVVAAIIILTLVSLALWRFKKAARKSEQETLS